MTPNLNILWARLILDGLLSGCEGIRHACVSPGSRSSPLAVALFEHADLAVSVHLDERSAAFFALGIGKATNAPAILVCTSGTAGANYLPAVIEASQARVPMIVLTADRPPEARATGEAQTCDQVHLYGRYPRFFQDLPLPEPELERLRQPSAIAAHAAATSIAPLPGPIHLNVPLREPLAPTPEEPERMARLEAEVRRTGRPTTGLRPLTSEHGSSPPSWAGPVASRIGAATRGLLVIGPTPGHAIGTEHLRTFARATGFPVVADVTSEIRFVVDRKIDRVGHADLLLRAESFAGEAPDLVVRIGNLPTSKSVRQYLKRHRTPTYLFQPDLMRCDPDATATWTIVADGTQLAAVAGELAEATRDVERQPWAERFRAGGRLAKELIDRGPIPAEAAAIRAAIAAVPDYGSVFFSNSLPIRWADAYLGTSTKPIRPFASRGVNGIDGITSTAFGIAYATEAPMLLVTGDLAFLHDISGLRSHRILERPAVILLLNNNGGGIFSHLPIASFPELFEPLFGTPHDGDLGAAARIFGIDHHLVQGIDELRESLAEGFGGTGTRIVEFRTDRNEMARAHERLVERIALACQDRLPRPTE